MTKFIHTIASIGIAAGVVLIGVALATLAYTPTEKEIVYIIEGSQP